MDYVFSGLAGVLSQRSSTLTWVDKSEILEKQMYREWEDEFFYKMMDTCMDKCLLQCDVTNLSSKEVNCGRICTNKYLRASNLFRDLKRNPPHEIILEPPTQN
eukprot:TRINITY_DN3052_c0_g1_i2.p1 TRINITY_DN3052_c0_g1~~TRINITY_DN3052_c0_g1_i2.p1  ORF type:complete len:103 (-),score=11.17 TRINITY_DN3052_c0_g1_i2:34-342(-)